MRRPLVGIALAVALGMMLASLRLCSFATLLSVALLLFLLAVLRVRRKGSGVLLFCCVASVAAARFMGADSALPTDHATRLLPRLPLHEARVIGRIADSPNFYPYATGLRGTWVFPLDCEGIETGVGWTRLRGRVQVRISGVSPEESFRQDERVCFSGGLRQRTYPGGDPVQLAATHWQRLAGPRAWLPSVWIRSLRERAAQTLSNGIETHAAQLAVYKALLLGYRKAVPADIFRQFTRTGTMHIFAISGLHVGMVGLLIVIVLKSMGVPRDKWGLWLLPLLFAYVFATGAKSSALRAFTMAAVYFLAPLLRRKPDVPNAIAFSAILLLFITPAGILSVGFLLSFTVVAFLVMAFAIVPERVFAKGGGWWRPAWRYVVSLVVTSIAAFIASAPLTALFFGTFSPVGLLGNLIVVPLTFCIVVIGWLAMLVPFASVIFNHAALVFIDGMLGAVGFLASLPGANWYVPSPPLLAILCWYAGWIHLLVNARRPRQRRAAFILIALALAWTLAPHLL